jgi:hypothetical protein
MKNKIPFHFQLNKESQNDVVCVTEANPKQIEEIVNTKLEQNLQQFKAKIEADMGKCERQLHVGFYKKASLILILFKSSS